MATKKKAATRKAASAAKPTEPEKPQANIIWADREKEPPAEVKIGMTTIELPAADEQRAGFHLENAARLIRQVPGFKEFRKKG